MDEVNNDYLIHYGVLGMKWGVRRQQRKEARRNAKQAKKKLERDWKSTPFEDRPEWRRVAREKYRIDYQLKKKLGKKKVQSISEEQYVSGREKTSRMLADAFVKGVAVASIGMVAATKAASIYSRRR